MISGKSDAASTNANTHGDWDGIEPVSGLRKPAAQSPAVLGVKPAFEDVDADRFLAF
jgi:hypothetical protein